MIAYSYDALEFHAIGFVVWDLGEAENVLVLAEIVMSINKSSIVITSWFTVSYLQ